MSKNARKSALKWPIFHIIWCFYLKLYLLAHLCPIQAIPILFSLLLILVFSIIFLFVHIPGWLGTHYVAQVGFELLILLSQCPTYWDPRNVALLFSVLSNIVLNKNTSSLLQGRLESSLSWDLFFLSSWENWELWALGRQRVYTAWRVESAEAPLEKSEWFCSLLLGRGLVSLFWK